jgi:hypothetical protein
MVDKQQAILNENIFQRIKYRRKRILQLPFLLCRLPAFQFDLSRPYLCRNGKRVSAN